MRKSSENTQIHQIYTKWCLKRCRALKIAYFKDIWAVPLRNCPFSERKR
ncbi:hypothetical protein CLONEX_00754 [[Clostridium] nexile DSM 1787]|nr:hypothetical protein CLONEX_00754 [[Clostridium] nexile DSM 1787]